MLLEAKSLKVYYDNVILAIDGIDLMIEQGEIASLLGANGAGKSSFLKAVSGLLIMENGRVTEGEIIFAGRRIDHLSPIERVKLGICLVAEGREILKNLTVEENLKVGTFIRRDSADAITKDYERVFRYFPVLLERRKQTAGTLSGGEQQMLVIARALMLKPRLLLLDEPSLGLAPIMAQSVIKEIQRVNHELGTTILLVEQNASLAIPISKRVYIVTNGRIALNCLSEEIKKFDISHYYLGRGNK